MMSNKKCTAEKCYMQFGSIKSPMMGNMSDPRMHQNTVF